MCNRTAERGSVGRGYVHHTRDITKAAQVKDDTEGVHTERLQKGDEPGQDDCREEAFDEAEAVDVADDVPDDIQGVGEQSESAQGPTSTDDDATTRRRTTS